MEKGESIISIALTALLVLIALGIKRQWTGSTFRSMATSAEDFVLKTAGLRGRIPELPGDERVHTFHLGSYNAALYRATPAPLVFASYHFIIFGANNKPLFKIDSIEATSTPWTTLYDFAGRRGRPDYHRRGPSVYKRDLTADGSPDILLGQYSGGDRCCTILTVIELANNKATVLGKISGLSGLPFEGLEIHRLDHGSGWDLVVHRPYRTACGAGADAADVISIYAYQSGQKGQSSDGGPQGQFTDQTQRFQPFLQRTLKSNLAQWNSGKARSLHLLLSLAADYASVGEAAEAQQFFQQNLPAFLPQLKDAGVDAQACLQDAANLVSSIAAKASQK